MFLTFETNEERARFLDEVRAERADLVDKLHVAGFQPTLVGRGLTSEETHWLNERMEGRGRVHKDVKFTPTI